MRKIVTREVEIKICDFCGKEVKDLEKCLICGREGCYVDGHKKHFAFKIDIRRESDGARVSGHVCKECAEWEMYPTRVAYLLNRLINREGVFLLE